eukprot:GHVR01029537.1.p1 GENE.GHVR01029537.1~~GHVR01029537.1.p1  ORF type:complete len:109 (+),score=10.56 GHVR01029537.1:1216-1542(+)
MALKKFFTQNNNLLIINKLVDTLCINKESLYSIQEKIIVKFNIPGTEFAPIKEVTNEDEEDNYEEEIREDKFQAIGNHNQDSEINEKVLVILSIKVEEMEKKLRVLLH